MAGVVTVLYPAPAEFNMDYYLKTHMPLVMKHWGPFGLLGYSIAKLNEAQGYTVQAVLQFKDAASIAAADADDCTKIVKGDIPNFTNVTPLIIGGQEVAKL